MTIEEKAKKVSKEIDKIMKKYNCQLGVWRTWEDLLLNINQMKQNPELKELYFTLQIKEVEENGEESTD